MGCVSKDKAAKHEMPPSRPNGPAVPAVKVRDVVGARRKLVMTCSDHIHFDGHMCLAMQDHPHCQLSCMTLRWTPAVWRLMIADRKQWAPSWPPPSWWEVE